MDINQLAAQIGSRMVEIVDCNTRLFVDADPTFESLFESIFDRYAGNNLPEWQYESVYNETFCHREVQTSISVAQELVREYIVDNAPVLITFQDILDYHRMSELLEVR